MKDPQIEQIFNDKIKLAQTIIEREFVMVARYRGLHREIRANNLTENDRMQQESFHKTLEILMQLYDISKYGYLKRLETKDKEKYDKFQKTIETYNRFMSITWEEFLFIYDTIIYVIELNGFHDVTTFQQTKTDFLKPRNKWAKLQDG